MHATPRFCHAGAAVVLWHMNAGAFSIRRFGPNEIDAAKQFLREKVGCTREPLCGMLQRLHVCPGELSRVLLICHRSTHIHKFCTKREVRTGANNTRGGGALTVSVSWGSVRVRLTPLPALHASLSLVLCACSCANSVPSERRGTS